MRAHEPRVREGGLRFDAGERSRVFRALSREEAADVFLRLDPWEQATLLEGLPEGEQRLWMRMLAPDDAADLLQQAEVERRAALLELLDRPTRLEVHALLAYAEDEAGGLMSPRYARLRPELRVEEAIRYLRQQSGEPVETLYYAYVLDPEQRLLGVVSLRQLVVEPPERRVSDIMCSDLVVAHHGTDQEEVARLLREHGLLAVPVVDDERRMRGIVTVDDVMDVVEEETTEDFHQMGGVVPLDGSLGAARLRVLYRRRIGWLLALVVVNMLSGAGIAAFEETIEATVALVFFLPLLIGSAGNAGAQASTLVVRGLATGDVRVRDWLRLFRRELFVSATLGLTMALAAALVSAVRAPEVLWVVALSMATIVVLGSLVGMLLPFALTRLRIDPATSSAPLITSIADVAGVLVYFSLARWLLGG